MLEFYKGKRILVTGHTGFKGAWLSRILLNAGAKVHGLALKAEDNSIFQRTGDFGFSESTILDIRNRAQLDEYIASKKFDGVFHLAAQPLVRKSYVEPVETFETNVMGTAHLLDSLVNRNSAPWVVCITTDKVYKNFEKTEGYTESEQLGGKDPYSASKAATEFAIEAWQNLAKLKGNQIVVSARAGNVIGGGDHAEDRLLPDLIRGFKSERKTVIRNPKSLRPWQHVLDPLNGYLTLGSILEKKQVSNAFNFGPSEESKLNVKEMADIACSIWPNNKGYEVVINPNNPPESGLLWLDSRLAKKELNWQSKLNAKQAIQWTLDWEIKSEKNNLLTVMDEQIEAFFKGDK